MRCVLAFEKAHCLRWAASEAILLNCFHSGRFVPAIEFVLSATWAETNIFSSTPILIFNSPDREKAAAYFPLSSPSGHLSAVCSDGSSRPRTELSSCSGSVSPSEGGGTTEGRGRSVSTFGQVAPMSCLSSGGKETSTYFYSCLFRGPVCP